MAIQFGKTVGINKHKINSIKTLERLLTNSTGIINLGVQIGLSNDVAYGDKVMQFGLANQSDPLYSGIQVGIINYGKSIKGLQIGGVNLCGKNSKGVHLGFVNYIEDGRTVPFVALRY